MQPWSLWVDMSTEHGNERSLTGTLGRRMQSALTGATGWVTETLSSDAETPGGRSVGPDGNESSPPHGSVRRGAEAIVTPEERFVRLVSENGGGMKQGEIVSAVEWSESTVSRRLSKLEDDGTITRYQIGREKLVFLPGNEPESLGSPWRDAAAD